MEIKTDATYFRDIGMAEAAYMLAAAESLSLEFGTEEELREFANTLTDDLRVASFDAVVGSRNADKLRERATELEAKGLKEAARASRIAADAIDGQMRRSLPLH